MHFGCPERSCLIADPSNRSIVPIDDVSWEQGVGYLRRSSLYFLRIKNSNIQQVQTDVPIRLLSSTPTETMGRFSLTAQAAVLLGKVIRNVNETSAVMDFQAHEAKVLEDTILALTNVSFQEGRARGISVCSPTTICYRQVTHGFKLAVTNSSAVRDSFFMIDVDTLLTFRAILEGSLPHSRRLSVRSQLRYYSWPKV